MILGTVHILLLAGLAVIIVLALVSPLESLRWWAGWSEDAAAKAAPHAATATSVTAVLENARWVVWLSGIGSVPGQTEDPFEVKFLQELRERVPNLVIVDDAFAYSVRDNPLAGKQLLDTVLRSGRTGLEAGKTSLLLGTTIQLRNTLQVAVSADGRYGPIYNLGLAEAVGKRLVARGYIVGSGEPVTLIGYSGGGQVSVGCARYLKQWLGAPIKVISIGGVISSDAGLASIDHLYHLQGSKDPMPALGGVFFVGRWPMLRYSHWNHAVQEGRVTIIPAGPMGHMAESGYFGSPYIDHTATIVADLIKETPDVEHAATTR